MADKRGDFGRRGEDAACAYLERHGYKVVDRNYRCRWGEIDVIAVKGGTLAFVEVKTRHNLRFGTPGMAVTYAKQQKIRTTALHYLQQQQKGYNNISFDVIEILADDGKAKLRHLPNCF